MCHEQIVDNLLKPFEGVTEKEELQEFIKCESVSGISPLHLASRGGYDAIVSKLLKPFEGVTQRGELQEYH